jgi:2-methylisocitrate lyase-like PEP mutase family enzyme
MADQVSLFRQLHQGPKILALPNAWDAASARIFEQTGFAAIATTSAGVANSLGYPDGEKISRDEMLAAIGRIVKAVSIPVSADVESGYGDPLGTAQRLVDLGAVGFNLEDSIRGEGRSLRNATMQAKAIEAIRAKTNLVVNARTDVFLIAAGDAETRVDEAIERLNTYRNAGADCLFAPGVHDAETIGTLAQAVKGPLNILAVAGTPPLAELERLGVARVTIGSGAMRATMGLTQRIARELLEQGTYSSFTESSMAYAAANRLFG